MVSSISIRGGRVVLPGRVEPATIVIKHGLIERVSSFDDVIPDSVLFDVGDLVVMPGLVDSHVHVNEPGRTEWEGFATATRAAAAGGVTTIVDMPLNSIPATTTVEHFVEKLNAAREKCSIDVSFWGGLVPGNAPELRRLFEMGVVGFKCFLVPSGVDEFPNVDEGDLREAMPLLAELGAVLIVHAESPIEIERAAIEARSGDPRRFETFLRSRTGSAEDRAVELMIRLCREFGTRVHIVHHSSAGSLAALRKAISEGLPITVETCPHYLAFAAEEIEDGATEFKCCPPIRERENREKLWDAVRDGTISMVVSDHSPCPPSMKRRDEGDFMKAWGGIASLQLRLPVMWSEAEKRGFGLADLAAWLCAEPARLCGIADRKGSISAGRDADLVIWDPDAMFKVEASMIHHRHKLTPYAGRELRGVVKMTFLRGELVYDQGLFPLSDGGRFVLRGA